MTNLDAVHKQVSEKLSEIAPLFKNPRLTLLVRSPDLADGDYIATADDLGEVIQAIKKIRDKGRLDINLDDLVEIHRYLGRFIMACNGGGLIQEINPDELGHIEETQRLIERMVAYMKKKAIAKQFDEDGN